MASNNIVLVHGLWTNSLSFEFWAHNFSERGYSVQAPGWPTFAGLGFRDIVEHYEQLVLALDEPPILIGHGIGGLVVQALLDRGLGTCGVAVASAPIKGIWTLPYTRMRVVTPQFFRPGRGPRTAALTPAQFHYAFMNTSSREEAQRAYERYAVPGPRRVLLQSELANLNPFSAVSINVRRNNRAPLLLVAAAQDHLAPPAVVRANARAYRNSLATTEYKEFPGRTHFIIAQSGWREVASYSLDWVRDQELLQQREARRLVREMHARQVA